MRRVFRFGLGRHVEREVDDELAFHIDMRVEKLIALGMTRDAARAEAMRQFGDMRSVRDNCVTLDEDRERSMQRANRWEQVGQDLSYAVRMLRRAPVFTAVVVLTLAVGIGANTAIFTLVDAVILRRLPVRDPDALVAMGNVWRVGSASFGNPAADLYSYPLYRDVRERNTVFTGLVASGRTNRLDVRVTPTAEPTRRFARFVSGNYFDVLGVRALAGRTFDAREDAGIGASPTVVLSEAYWTREFDRDPGAIGRTLIVNGTALTIVGVAAPGYEGEIVGARYDMWIPLTMQHALSPSWRMLDDRNSNFLLLLGRLKPGVTIEQAQSALTPLVRQAIADHATPSYPASLALEADVPISSGAKGFSRVRQTYAAPLYTLMAGVGLLLLIICANVANLLLARAVTRQREMSVRAAIGAGRARILRQLLTESALLAAVSAAAGLLVAWWGSKLLLWLASGGPTLIPVDLRLNLPVLAFTGGTAILAVAIFGITPALRASRVDLAAAMRTQGRSVMSGWGGGRASRLGGGRLLIVLQVAISLVLLVGAGLLVRNLVAIQNQPLPLDRDHLLIASVDANERGYAGDRRRALIRDLTERFTAIPGVAAVTLSSNGIFSGIDNQGGVGVPGFAARVEDDTLVRVDNIGPGYVRTIGGRLLEGRELTEADGERAAPVALVNAAFAKFFFAGKSAIGATIRLDTTQVQIIGVMADIPYHDMTEERARRVFMPFFRYDPDGDPGALNFIVRTKGDPTLAVGAVRSAIKAIDPLMPTDRIDPLTTLMQGTITQERLVARLATGFGVLALFLAAVGLYGVLNYAVTRRTSEIGLRVALGAVGADVVRMVIRDALLVVVLGLVVGAPLATVAVRYLGAQLYGVEASDPVSIAIAVSVLLAAAVVASMLPARRAARVDPLSALRSD